VGHFSFCAQQLNSGQGHLIFLGFLIRHTQTRAPTHPPTREDSSERVISSSQSPLPTQHTTNTTDELPSPQRLHNT